MLKTLLLRLIHYIIGVWLFVRRLIFQFPIAYSVLYRKTDLARIRSDAKSLKKLPLHVGLVVVENDYSYSDLANVIVWSVALGISYISVYDINGEIKRNSFLLQSEVQKSKQHILGTDHCKYDVEFHSHSSSEKTEGGCSNTRQVRVRILSLDDGQQNLVELTRTLGQMVVANQYLTEDIVPNNVDLMLQDIHKCPDPDMVIKFGPVDSLMGFLPWQVRLTEILSVHSHWNMSYNQVVCLMIAYGDTEFRLGY